MHILSTDTLQVVTTAAVATDVHVSYEETPNGTQAAPARKRAVNTAITTATTTTILAGPSTPTDSSWLARTVKQLDIRNKGASPQTVTVRHVGRNASDAAVTVELISTTLPPGASLHFDHESGWYSSTGSISGETVVTSTADTVNSAADTLANVAGLSAPVEAGDTYHFRAVIPYAADATTSGSRWTINGPAITSLAYRSNYGLTTTSETVNNGLGAHQLPAAANASSPAAAASNVAVVEGVFTPSAAGNLVVQFAAEAGTITAKAGATLTVRKVADVA